GQAPPQHVARLGQSPRNGPLGPPQLARRLGLRPAEQVTEDERRLELLRQAAEFLVEDEAQFRPVDFASRSGRLARLYLPLPRPRPGGRPSTLRPAAPPRARGAGPPPPPPPPARRPAPAGPAQGGGPGRHPRRRGGGGGRAGRPPRRARRIGP